MRTNISKLLVSDSVRSIDSPLMTDAIGRSVVRGYETAVILKEGEPDTSEPGRPGAIRALVFQDNDRRNAEINTLYIRISELEKRLEGRKYDPFLKSKLSDRELEILSCLEVEDDNGINKVTRLRNAISAKENKCGRFAVITTSKDEWIEILRRYRSRNEVEYDFSQLQSDLIDGVTGKSDQHSAEGGLLVNFLSLRLRLSLINRMKAAEMTETMWVPDVIKTLKKLKISKIGDDWRLNEVTKSQSEMFENLGFDPKT